MDMLPPAARIIASLQGRMSRPTGLQRLLPTSAVSIAHAYAELGLAPDASESEVKTAWRRLASQWHPDRNPSAAAVAHMQRINQAWDDIRRHRLQQPAATAPEPPAAAVVVARTVELTLEQAALGCIQPLSGELTVACDSCQGQGHRLQPGACASCHGSGEVATSAWYGWMRSRQRCSACDGSGNATLPCPDCHGSGQRPRGRYRVKVRIPPGVRDGDALQVGTRSRHSAAEPGSPSYTPVTLDLQVRLAAHPFFQLLDDGTLRLDWQVDGFAWLAGHAATVPTPDGPISLNLQRGQTLHRLPGRGFPASRRGARADLLVYLRPSFPERLGERQQQLLDQLAADSGADAGLRRQQAELQAWTEGRHGGGA